MRALEAASERIESRQMNCHPIIKFLNYSNTQLVMDLQGVHAYSDGEYTVLKWESRVRIENELVCLNVGKEIFVVLIILILYFY